MGDEYAAMVVGDSVSMSLHVQHNCPSLASPERRKEKKKDECHDYRPIKPRHTNNLPAAQPLSPEDRQ